MLTLRQLLQNRLALSAAGLLGIIGIFCLLIEWQPSRQVEKRFNKMLQKISDRKWDSVLAGIDETYKDRWGFDRERVIRESREVMQLFISVELLAQDVVVETEGDSGKVTARILLRGSGAHPIAEMAKSEVNSLTEPFVFEFRKKSWKPWDWKVTGIDQPELDPAKYQ